LRRHFDQRDFFVAEAVELVYEPVDFAVGALDFGAPAPSSAPQERNVIAQGEALGNKTPTTLKP
jgi:hypothetical protein